MTTKSLVAILIVPMFALLALPGLAEEQTPPNNPPAANTPNPQGLACAQTAVEKRDNAIISAFDTFSASAKAALQSRKDALKAAWAITDRKARRAAIKKAWNDFTAAIKTARKTLNSARKAAWTQYAKDLKDCRSRGTVTTEDYGTQGLEANL